MKRSRLALCSLLACAVASAATTVGCNLVQRRDANYQQQFERAGLRPELAEVEGARLRVWRGGRGTPVLLLHGMGSVALWQWTPVAESLADRHLVLAPDLVWFGQSISDRDTHTLDYQVDVMAALLERLDQPAAVIGISYGGFVAWQLAHDHPDLVSRVVMLDSPGPVFTTEDARALHARFGETSMADIFAPRSADDMKRLVAVGYAHPPWAPGFALAQYHRLMIEPYVEQQRGLMDDLERKAASGALRVAIDKPVLLVWGRGDPVFPLEQGERLARFAGPHARLVVIEDSAHAPNLEHPEAFERAVAPFLAD